MNGKETMIEKALNDMFERLVPPCGKAETKAGEILRAYFKINYRFYNDGDCIDIDYGKETCNAPARFLKKNTDSTISKIIDEMWGTQYDDDEMNELASAIHLYLINHKELEETPNTDDMYDCTNSYVDTWIPNEDDFYDPSWEEDDEDDDYEWEDPFACDNDEDDL